MEQEQPRGRRGGNGDAVEVHGNPFQVSLAEAGLKVRCVGLFQDEAEVFASLEAKLATIRERLAKDGAASQTDGGDGR